MLGVDCGRGSTELLVGDAAQSIRFVDGDGDAIVVVEVDAPDRGRVAIEL